MKKTFKFALAALLISSSYSPADTLDCIKLSQAVKAAVVADSDKVLQIVAKNVSANESCACEIVKAAIVGSDADKVLVAKIVNTAILEAPSQLRMIAQCAIASAPEAISSIQAVVEKYDAAGGEGESAKGGFAEDDPKGMIDLPEDGPNPLDYPFASVDDPIVKESRYLPEFFYGPVPDDSNVTSVLSTPLR